MSLKGSFGKHLKILRNERKITQEKLAERIGVSEDRIIRNWERGDDFPSSDNLERLCKELHITIRELFDFDYP